jgi:hypothetical protein
MQIKPCTLESCSTATVMPTAQLLDVRLDVGPATSSSTSRRSGLLGATSTRAQEPARHRATQAASPDLCQHSLALECGWQHCWSCITTGRHYEQHQHAHLSRCHCCCICWKRATLSVLRTPGATVPRWLPHARRWQYKDSCDTVLLRLLLHVPPPMPAVAGLEAVRADAPACVAGALTVLRTPAPPCCCCCCCWWRCWCTPCIVLLPAGAAASCLLLALPQLVRLTGTPRVASAGCAVPAGPRVRWSRTAAADREAAGIGLLAGLRGVAGLLRLGDEGARYMGSTLGDCLHTAMEAGMHSRQAQFSQVFLLEGGVAEVLRPSQNPCQV